MDASLLDLDLDLDLVEGFKHEPVAKMMFFREGSGHTQDELVLDEYVIAIASNVPLDVEVPVLDLNDLDAIVAFILAWLKAKN